jgi:N-acyl-D-aspartate/D-glutamate deacylase
MRFLTWLLPMLLAAQTYDVVLQNGRVVDPESGLDAVRSVGVSGKKIAAVSAHPLRGDVVVDASGLVIAPGFIDLHSHGQTPENYRFKAMDGVTTALELEVGVSPVSEWYTDRDGRALINFGASTSHIQARMLAMKDAGDFLHGAVPANRRPNPEEQAAIVALDQKGLDEGALGVGLSLVYTYAATPPEVLELFHAAAKRKRTVFVHMRYVGDASPGVIEALQEVIADALVAGAAVHIVHINSTALMRTPEALRVIDAARARGLDVTTEAYPYIASGGRVQVFNNTEEMLRTAIGHPLVMIASDGRIEEGHGHPRSAGTYARVLGKYVREDKVLSLMDAIRKSSLMPAQRMESMSPQMREKGRLRVGADADITVFDAKRVIDRATYENPAQYSEGFRYVMVGGTFVVREGKLLEGVAPGSAIRAR